MARRSWFKIHAKQWLEGSISEESLELRGFWVTLLALVADGNYADEGQLKAGYDVGFTPKTLGLLMKISPQKVGVLLKILQQMGRVLIDSRGVVTVVNWQKYQSEYLRQKPYRNCNQKLHTEKERGGEGCNPSPPEKEKERGEGESATAATSIFTLYEDTIGQVPDILRTELLEYEDRFTDDWLMDAFKEAAKYNRRSWPYVTTILESWAQNGRSKKRNNDESDPNAYYDKYKHFLEGKVDAPT